jgi:hypothetical protein
MANGKPTLSINVGQYVAVLIRPNPMQPSFTGWSTSSRMIPADGVENYAMCAKHENNTQERLTLSMLYLCGKRLSSRWSRTLQFWRLVKFGCPEVKTFMSILGTILQPAEQEVLTHSYARFRIEAVILLQR